MWMMNTPFKRKRRSHYAFGCTSLNPGWRRDDLRNTCLMSKSSLFNCEWSLQKSFFITSKVFVFKLTIKMRDNIQKKKKFSWAFLILKDPVSDTNLRNPGPDVLIVLLCHSKKHLTYVFFSQNAIASENICNSLKKTHFKKTFCFNLSIDIRYSHGFCDVWYISFTEETLFIPMSWVVSMWIENVSTLWISLNSSFKIVKTI